MVSSICAWTIVKEQTEDKYRSLRITLKRKQFSNSRLRNKTNERSYSVISNQIYVPVFTNDMDACIYIYRKVEAQLGRKNTCTLRNLLLTYDKNAKHPAKDHHVIKTCIYVPPPSNREIYGEQETIQNDVRGICANSSTFHETLILY